MTPHTRQGTKKAVFLLSAVCSLIWPPAAFSAVAVPAEWQYSQDLAPVQKGLARVQLPMETLSAAQAGLGDVRLVDAGGKELAYAVQQPQRMPAQDRVLDELQQRLEKGRTVIAGRIPADLLAQGVDRLYLYTDYQDFLKAVTIENSADGKTWKTLVRSAPIFNHAGALHGSSPISLSPIRLPLIRVTLDDVLSPPIAVNSIRVFSAERTVIETQPIEPLFSSQNHARESEVTVTFPAAHLTLGDLHFDLPETAFHRPVTAVVKVFRDGEFREEVISKGMIYRVPLNNQQTQQLALPINRTLPGRQIILRIDNGDSRPLAIKNLKADVLPAALIFDAPEAGIYTLHVGNPDAHAPGYDLSVLQDDLSRAAAQKAVAGPLQPNPHYQPAQTLAQVSESGSEIDTESWSYRKKVQIVEPGIQRIELDLETLSHNQNRSAALRLVRKQRQVPYVLDPMGVERSFSPNVEALPARGRIGAWAIVLPYDALPITTLRFTVPESLFQRNVTLVEETKDERGDTVRQTLAQGVWMRTAANSPYTFTLPLYRAPTTGRLILEMDHGDNAPIHIEKVQAFYRTPRLIFKTQSKDDLYLYYGQPEAAAPHYDLNLVSHELLNAQPREATLNKEEVLKVRPWWQPPVPAGSLKYVFWAVLILMVGGLLFAIARLLPEEHAS